jgi:hypothetical protein
MIYSATFIRKRGSRKINCPMKVVIRAVDTGDIEGPWELWYSEAGGAITHNHPPDNLISMPIYRHQFREKHRTRIREMTSTGIETGKIIANIAEQYNQEESLIMRRDIYNKKVAEKQDILLGEGPLITRTLKALEED